jgi:hypothetical protein
VRGVPVTQHGIVRTACTSDAIEQHITMATS